jgi:hypothetical protein
MGLFKISFVVSLVSLESLERVCFLSARSLFPFQPGGFYPEQIRFVLGTAGFPLSCLPSLFAFKTIGPFSSYSSFYQTSKYQVVHSKKKVGNR